MIDVFFQKLKAFQVQVCNFIADLYTLHHIKKICRQYMNHCNLCSSSINLCFLTSVIKQKGAMWANRSCGTHVNRNRYYFNHSEEGKKMLNNEPESKSYEFFESSVI